jgi:hypothetical protein
VPLTSALLSQCALSSLFLSIPTGCKVVATGEPALRGRNPWKQSHKTCSTHVDRATSDFEHLACNRFASIHAHDKSRFATPSWCMLAQPTRLVKLSHAPRACITIALADSLIVAVRRAASSAGGTLLPCAALQHTNVARGEALRTPGKKFQPLLDSRGSCNKRLRTPRLQSLRVYPRPRQVAFRDAVVVHVGAANTFWEAFARSACVHHDRSRRLAYRGRAARSIFCGWHGCALALQRAAVVELISISPRVPRSSESARMVVSFHANPTLDVLTPRLVPAPPHARFVYVHSGAHFRVHAR